MADKVDITGVRITGSAQRAGKLADAIEALDGSVVIKRLETKLSNRPVPGLRVHLTVLHGYPTAARIHAWLAANGWEAKPRGPVAALWFKGGDARVFVPNEDGDDMATSGALQRIAAAEGMTVGALVAAIHVHEPATRKGITDGTEH